MTRIYCARLTQGSSGFILLILILILVFGGGFKGGFDGDILFIFLIIFLLEGFLRNDSFKAIYF